LIAEIAEESDEIAETCLFDFLSDLRAQFLRDLCD
jgi:hypothetical protein